MEYSLTDNNSYSIPTLQIKQEPIVFYSPELNACEGFDDAPESNNFIDNPVNNVDVTNIFIKREANDENHLTPDFCNGLDELQPNSFMESIFNYCANSSISIKDEIIDDRCVTSDSFDGFDQCVINTLDNEEAVYERIANENCKLYRNITFTLGNQKDCIDDKSIPKPLLTIIKSDKLHETLGENPEKYNDDKSEVIRNKFNKRKFIEIIQSDDLEVSPKRKKTNEPKILLDNNKESQKSQKQTNLLNYMTEVRDLSELIKTKKKKINVNDYIANKNTEILKNNEKQNNIKTTVSDAINIPKLSLIKNQNSGKYKRKYKIKKKDERNSFNRCCIKCDNIHSSEKNRIGKNCPKCKTPFLFECKKCKRKYKIYSSMYTHIYTSKCYSRSIFKCDHCDFEATRKINLSSHIEHKHFTIHPKDYNICSKCGKGFKTLTYLHKHEKYCKTDHYFKCSICSYDTKVKTNFVQHMHIHYINRNEQDIADDSSNEKIDSKNSAQRKSPSADIKKCMIDYCYNCENGTEPKKYCRKCKNCRSLLSFRCTICSADSVTRAKLYQHVKLSHFPYEREQCPKCKKYVDNFVRHRRDCEKQPNFQCSYCSFKTKSKSRLKEHIHTQHLKSDPIKCGKCDKFYKNVYSLRKHQSWCNKEPHLKCDHCAFKAAEKGSIRRHMLMRHIELFTDRKLQCEFCKIKISNLYLLEQHIAKCGKDV